jgi:hypothetical protein
MLITILRTNLWIPAAALALILSVGIVIYDNLRTPEYVRRLEESGYPINTATLKSFNTPIDEAQNANALLYKATRLTDYPHYFTINNKPRFPITPYWWEGFVGTAPLVKLDQIYPLEQEQALRTYVEFNTKALELIWKASEYPKFFPDFSQIKFSKYGSAAGTLNDYAELAQLVACEGLDALLRDDLTTLIKDTNTLLKLKSLLQQPDIPNMSYRTSYITKIITLLIENALNRSSLPAEPLIQWAQQLKQSSLIDSHKILHALVYSVIEEILENRKDTNTFLSNDWNAGSLYLNFTGTWDNINKIILPRMGGDIYQLIQSKDSNSPLQLMTIYEKKKSILQSVNPPSYHSFTKRKLDLSQYNPVPYLYRFLWRVDDIYAISLIKSYLSQSASASVTQTGIALYRYGQDHGRFPDTLQELVPEYLDAIPVNPFTEDEPVNYRQEEDRVIVYIEGKEISFTLLKKTLEKEIPSTATQEQTS